MLNIEAGYKRRLTKLCEEARHKDPQGQKISNRGFGWQVLFKGEADVFQPLYRAAAGTVNQYANKLGKQAHAWKFVGITRKKLFGRPASKPGHRKLR